MLIECPECKNQISDKAPACPHCGCPVAKQEEMVVSNGAQIRCPVCSCWFLEKLDACPKCGAGNKKKDNGIKIPTDSVRVEPGMTNQAKVQTIEMTSKKYKGQILLSFGIIVIGIFTVFSGTRNGPGVGVLMVVGGLIWHIVARICAWWNHG